MNQTAEDVTALVAEMNAARARRELSRTRWVSGLIGFAIGGLLTAGVFFLLIVPKTQALTASVNQIAAERDALQQKLKDTNLQLGNTQFELHRASAELAAAQMPESQTPLYTLLYDPAPAGQTSSAAQLLDLVRPGLGTALGKLQDATRQGPAGNPRWLIPGYARPVVNGNPQGFYYQWANLQTGEIETHSPRGTTITGAN